MRGLRFTFMAVCAALLSCSQSPAPPATAPGLRIVSLSPAMTQAVVALGGGASIVGRTPWCTGVDAPVMGTLEDRDLGRIAEVQPTCFLVQARTADPALERLARAHGAEMVVTHIDRLADIESMVDQVADVLTRGGVQVAAARRAEVADQAGAARKAARAAVQGAGRTLLLFSAEPATAFGTETYVSDLWQALGGTNALARSGYPELSLEDIARLDPECILLIRTGGSDIPHSLRALPKALGARVRVVQSPVLLEPSTGFLVQGPGILAAAVQGEVGQGHAVHDEAAVGEAAP